jgi:predicted DNA-binding antitoxin AbrB/MazE fold protein
VTREDTTTYIVSLVIDESEINKHDGKYTLQSKNTSGECISSIQVNIKANPNRKKAKPVKKEEPKVEEKQPEQPTQVVDEPIVELKPVEFIQEKIESVIFAEEKKETVIIEQTKYQEASESVQETIKSVLETTQEEQVQLKDEIENLVLQKEAVVEQSLVTEVEKPVEEQVKISELPKIEVVEAIKPSFLLKPKSPIDLKEGDKLTIEARIKASAETQVKII